MSIDIIFETHALTEDNEEGRATGWLPGRLSEQGRRNAVDMGRRRRADGIAAVFGSDLRRSVETIEIAFGDTNIPILYDWRLRECDFGSRNGTASSEVERDRTAYIDQAYPGGESHRAAINRVARALADLPTRWDGQRVMVIGHLATYRGLEHVVHHATIEDLLGRKFEWREHGWEYRLGAAVTGG